MGEHRNKYGMELHGPNDGDNDTTNALHRYIFLNIKHFLYILLLGRALYNVFANRLGRIGVLCGTVSCDCSSYIFNFRWRAGSVALCCCFFFYFLAIFTTTSICLERFVRYIERLQRVVVLISHGSNADCSKLVPFSLDKVKRALSCGTEKCVDSTGALTWVRPPVPKLCRARVMAVRPDPRPALKPDGTVIGRP